MKNSYKIGIAIKIGPHSRFYGYLKDPSYTISWENSFFMVNKSKLNTNQGSQLPTGHFTIYLIVGPMVW